MTEQSHSEAFLTDAMHAWGDTVYRLALSQMRSPADADDVYQDVFLRLYNSTTAFEGPEHLKAWLLRVTVNRCHDINRSGWKKRSTPLGEAQYAAPAPMAELFDSDVWDAVGELPEDLRAAIHLYYVEGYSTDEIAKILDCKPSTARTRLRRARIALKGTLTEQHPHCPREESAHGPRSRHEALPFDDARCPGARPSI